MTARPTSRQRRYAGAPLLGTSALHLTRRFSYGVTPALSREVRAASGAPAWFARQLRPAAIADPAAEALSTWWPSLTLPPGELWQRQIEEIEGGWEVMGNYQRWLLMRRITSRRQVHEVMTEFWMNHLHVSVHHDAVFTYRFDYDRVVRSHALGRYVDLLQAAIVHPAMGMYLDNAVSTKTRINENLGRELLELHTVGRGAYTEDDVKASARILTGHVVDMWRTWQARYSPADHWTGPVRVMGFSHANSDPDGRPVLAAYLAYLARHPRTAERLARKLCLRFVSDTPSARLVAQLAQVYLAHDTAIGPVLSALVASPEFAASVGTKVRDPGEDIVATYRALGVTVAPPPSGENGAAATALLWQCDGLGAVPHAWPRPDGQPVDNASWASPSRMLASFEMHWSMSGRWWPSEGITYRTPRAWLPRARVRFDVLIDHMAQQLLGTHASPALLSACVIACPDDLGITPSTLIGADHPLMQWSFHRVIATILDSPAHLTR
ncbi:DUF1800 domain-containing protein [Nocardioides sp. R-C-SC26]|uniref:DUF1800 domain-containing protein n=1 Tax=Nocardioides sp. R-C-SC26 TaxID=2870414 RepID=UPI001E603FC3|nr:DUF1800 domain-containing protein [Nocardioides sp. R-C-SC26]